MFNDIIKKEKDKEESYCKKIQRFWDSLSEDEKDSVYEEVDEALDHFVGMWEREPTDDESLAITGEILRRRWRDK